MLLPRTLLLERKTPATALEPDEFPDFRQVTVTHNQMPSQLLQPNGISLQDLVADPVKPSFQSQSGGQSKGSCEQSQLTNRPESPLLAAGSYQHPYLGNDQAQRQDDQSLERPRSNFRQKRGSPVPGERPERQGYQEHQNRHEEFHRSSFSTQN